MPYITREDGEHFVIPSYRDVIVAKNKGQLKKEILMLSQNYGEYITLQRKAASQYEVAFSPDTGYLLGESIWQYFKRPLDMIYCEAIPNTMEAILVIVKAGSVYLDGSFPLDSIPEELIIFLTQQNHFEIYTYGNVPISHFPEEGKFSFDTASVKSFTALDRPVFPTLPLLKMYQLQLVDPVLKSVGIGVFPTKELIAGAALLGLVWLGYSYFTSNKEVEVTSQENIINPYQTYYRTLNSPGADTVINRFLEEINLLYSMPGWRPNKMIYMNGGISALVISQGGKTQDLFDWAQENKMTVNVKQDGIYLAASLNVPKRSLPTQIYPIKQVLAKLLDSIHSVYPASRYKISDIMNKGKFSNMFITITIEGQSPVVVSLVAQQMKDLPLVLQSIVMTPDKNGNLSGPIIIQALGN